MKKYLLLFLFSLILVGDYANSAPPTRQNDYIPLTTIRDEDVEANEDEIFEYLQTGVDTIRTSGLNEITEIDSSLRSGGATVLITGGQGLENEVGKWDADGDWTHTDGNMYITGAIVTVNGIISGTQVYIDGSKSCDTLDTNANGLIVCGTDGGGSGGSNGWTDDGTEVRLETSTDEVEIGSAGTLSAKLAVNGDADEVQTLIQGNATQTTDIFVVEDSTGANIITANSGTILASTSFQVQGGGISAVGAIGGHPPLTGAGVRFFWYPEWAALRAGEASGTQFDPVNIGYGSIAVGQNVTASGDNSIAMGYSALANSPYAIALGSNPQATSTGSLAFGTDTASSGRDSLAIGFASIVSGDNAVGIGESLIVSGTNALALGQATQATQSNSTAIGYRYKNAVPSSLGIGWSPSGITTDSDFFINANVATVNAALTIVGEADTNELTIRGNATQTTDIFVVEDSAGANIITAALGGIRTSNLSASSLTGCSGLTNSGKLTTNSNGDVFCAADVSGGAGGALDDLTDVGTAAETAGLMLIADGTDYEGVAMSGDVTITSAGVTTITANSVALGTDTTGNYALGVSEGGNATDVTCVNCLGEAEIDAFGTTINTATAGLLLIADGTDFEAVALSGDATVTSAGVVTIPTGSVSLTELSDVGTVAITAGQLLIADGTDYESVAMSGDTTITSAGVTTVVANSISFADLSDVNTASATAGVFLVADGTDYESVSMNGSCTMDKGGTVTCVSSGGASTLDDLTDVGTAAETAGLILIADGTDYEGVALSGDATVTSAGVITIVANSFSLADASDVNTATATAGNILIADGTDFESRPPKFLWVLEPQQGKLDATGPMAIDAGNSTWRGLFDASAVETVTHENVLYSYGGAGFDSVILYSMASATSGTVEFDVLVWCNSPDDAVDIDTESFGTANVFTETVPSTAGHESAITLTNLNEDNCASGDHIIVEINRDAVDATNDTATGDAELRKVYIYER